MADIESPCNKICALDPSAALCVGCGRNLAEIEGWVRLSAAERARIMSELPQRLAALGLAPAEPLLPPLPPPPRSAAPGSEGTR